jgi:predicted ATP-dependent serine protease
MPEDFPETVRRAKAAEKARQAAIAAPQRPHRATNRGSGGSGQAAYLAKAISDEVEKFGDLPKIPSARNDALNIAAYNLGQLVNPTGLQPGVHGLDPNQIRSELEDACRRNGLWDDPEDGPAQCRKTLQSGYLAGLKHPRDLSDKGLESGSQNGRIQPGHATKIQLDDTKKSKTEPGHKGNQQPDLERTVRLQNLASVKTRVPMWVWEHDSHGRIQLGTLTMFAGKPGAGKSTALRWFAARLSRGELPGVWFEHPMKVAIIQSEEQVDAVVVPGLYAANAELRNVFRPEFRFGGAESEMMAQADEQRLTDELCDNNVRALFIDPIMATFSGKADVYRNNEVREYLAPYTRIAKAINGIVIGVTHLRKGDVADVLGSINGSSAFGEVPRAVFGFAPTDTGDYIFEQVKNSAGLTGLKLAYRLPVEFLMADDGQTIELPRFEIIGPSEISISDIAANSEGTTKISVAMEWLKMYLLENQPAPSSQVKQDAKRHGDINEKMIQRAASRLGVKIWPTSEPGKPHMTVWRLPGWDSEP